MNAFNHVFESSDEEEEARMTLKANVTVLRSLRAREEGAWCLCQLGRHQEALNGLENVSQKLNASSSGDEDNEDAQINSDRARCFWRIGKCLLASEGESK